MTHQLLRILVVLGIGANIGFLLINLSPERPRLGKRRKVKMLLRTDEARKKWLTENVLTEFGAARDVDFDVAIVDSFDEVVARLEAEKQKPTGLALAAIDDAHTHQVIDQGLARPFVDAVEPEVFERGVKDYLPEALEQGRDAKGKQWFLPRRAQIDIAVFLRPAIEEAYLNWETDRRAIDAVLAQVNGVGLPKGYELKRTVDTWDTYDLFVAAWYWAHHPAPWSNNGQRPTNGNEPTVSLPPISPRIALRIGESDSALRDLISSFYRHGLKEEQLGQIDVPPVIDALQWTALFRKHGLVVEDKKGIDAEGVRKLLRARQIAWATMNQEDSFWLHGGSDRDAARGMRGARDLGWSIRPIGVSLELKDGLPARTGKSFSFMQVQLWALPANAPSPELSYRLARFMSRRAMHQRETEAQGLLPIRKDVQQDYSILFRLEWMQRILDASYRQIRRGAGHLPDLVLTRKLDQVYQKVRDAVLREPGPLRYETVRQKALEVAHGR